MAKPKVFISSTFYDLRHIRSSLEGFVESLGFEAILSEKGSIAYNPEIPLDESCYRDAESCDILVLIVGGRYGSPSSNGNQDAPVKKGVKPDFFQRYESITKMEYETASKKGIPMYILIEKSVYAEFDTFRNNRDNKSIIYAHVDSVNVFGLIERIINQPRNNPIFTFERHIDIEHWLKEQWSGLFKELLTKRTEGSQIASLSKQVNELAEINKTLKTYLEEVVSKVSGDSAAKIIRDEEKRLAESRLDENFKSFVVVKTLLKYSNSLTPDLIKKYYIEATSIEDLTDKIYGENTALIMIDHWKSQPGLYDEINAPRIFLGLPPLEFISVSPNLPPTLCATPGSLKKP